MKTAPGKIPINNYKNRRFRGENGGFTGASDLTRTGDLLITRARANVLYRFISFDNVFDFFDISSKRAFSAV